MEKFCMEALRDGPREVQARVKALTKRQRDECAFFMRYGLRLDKAKIGRVLSCGADTITRALAKIHAQYALNVDAVELFGEHLALLESLYNGAVADRRFQAALAIRQTIIQLQMGADRFFDALKQRGEKVAAEVEITEAAELDILTLARRAVEEHQKVLPVGPAELPAERPWEVDGLGGMEFRGHGGDAAVGPSEGADAGADAERSGGDGAAVPAAEPD